MQFWNPFKKSKEAQEVEETQDEEGEIVTAITYSIDEEGEMFIDITVSSFEDEVIERLAELVCTISTEKCHLITTEMIKVNMEEEGEEDKLEKLLGLIIKNQIIVASQKLIEQETKNGIDSEEPCIKPSDMI